MPDRKLLAWIEPKGSEAFQAAFVGAPALHQRAPATQLCSSPGEAREWVEQEAATLNVPVEWLPEAPRGGDRFLYYGSGHQSGEG